jgi:hypothetical protein
MSAGDEADEGDDAFTQCACGQDFPGWEELTEHILAAFPPHADTPLDGRYHADLTDDFGYINASIDQYGTIPPRTTHARARTILTDITRMLDHRPYLGMKAIDGLEALGQMLIIRLARWDFEAWANSPEPHLRAAAAIAHRIETGDIIPGQQLHPGLLAVGYQVGEQVIGAAITTLIEHGHATIAGGRIEAAERKAGTGQYLREYYLRYARHDQFWQP